MHPARSPTAKARQCHCSIRLTSEYNADQFIFFQIRANTLIAIGRCACLHTIRRRVRRRTVHIRSANTAERLGLIGSADFIFFCDAAQLEA
jgi:hypothetical protein